MQFENKQTFKINAPRQERLLALVNENGSMSINELATIFNVSEQTIRRDIIKLEKMELLSRYHGGVIRNNQFIEIQQNQIVNKDFEIRELSYVDEKEKIAKAVAELIPDGSTVFITIGTTVEKIAKALCHKNSLRVITDSIRVANILYKNTNIEVMLPSGTLRASNGGIEGPNTAISLAAFRADFTISSVGAIDADGTLLDFNLSEVTVAKTMMNNSKKTIIACDHSKFDAVASVCLDHINNASYLVTDTVPNKEFLEIINKSSCQLVLA